MRSSAIAAPAPWWVRADRSIGCDDPRVRNTFAAIERDLMMDGLVKRNRSTKIDDGLPPGEGTFLACSFWLAEVWAKQGRATESRAMFERLVSLCNDVGLLSEQYSPKLGRQLGNFPQALSHLALISTAPSLEGEGIDQSKLSDPVDSPDMSRQVAP